MLIRYVCPHCKAALRSPGALAGKKNACPKCGLQLEVPTPKGELLPERAAPTSPASVTVAPAPTPNPFDFDSAAPAVLDELESAPAAPGGNPGGGAVALVLGVVGFFLFPPLGFVALWLGSKALRNDPSDALAKAGLMWGRIDAVWCLVWFGAVGAVGWLVLGNSRPMPQQVASEGPVPPSEAPAAVPDPATAEPDDEARRAIMEKVHKIEQERRRVEAAREQEKMERERTQVDQQQAAEVKARRDAEREAKLKKDAEEAARLDAERDAVKKEATAVAKLNLAKRYFEEGNRDLGKKKLREILDQFPQTKAAKEAKELLDRMS
jgi:hypothetical protein